MRVGTGGYRDEMSGREAGPTFVWDVQRHHLGSPQHVKAIIAAGRTAPGQSRGVMLATIVFSVVIGGALLTVEPTRWMAPFFLVLGAYVVAVLLLSPSMVRRRLRGTPGALDPFRFTADPMGTSCEARAGDATTRWFVSRAAVAAEGHLVLVGYAGLLAVLPDAALRGADGEPADPVDALVTVTGWIEAADAPSPTGVPVPEGLR